MKTTKPAVILLALVLLIAATARSDEKPAKKQISNTRTASCLVKITTDEAVLPLSEFVVEDLLRSSGIAGKAAREVLEISPDFASELFEIEEVFGVDSLRGGTGLGGYGGGMGLPANATPGASKLGTPTTSRFTSALRTPTTPARSPARTSAVRTTRSPTTTATPARRTPTSRAPTRTTTPTRPAPRRTPTLTQPLTSTAEQTILFRLQVDLSQASAEEPIKSAAEEFMMALISNLRSALSGAFENYRLKFNQQFDLARDEVVHAEQELVRMQAELREISGSRDLSRQVILRDISSLRQKLQTAKMEQASSEALMEATTKRIAKIEADLKEEIGKDPVTDELQRMFELQFERLQRTKKLELQGSVSSAELADAEEKLARARIELAKRREELSKSAGGDRINSLNQQVSDYSIQFTRAVEDISSLEQQLVEAKDLLEKADGYEVLLIKAEIARQDLEETLLWHARLGRNARSIRQPDVTVIGAAD